MKRTAFTHPQLDSLQEALGWSRWETASEADTR